MVEKKTHQLNQNCPMEVMGLAWLIACSFSTPNRKPLFTLRVAYFFFWLSNWVKPPWIRTFSAMKFFINFQITSIKSLVFPFKWLKGLEWENQDPFMNAKKTWETKIPRVLLLYIFFQFLAPWGPRQGSFDSSRIGWGISMKKTRKCKGQDRNELMVVLGAR